MNAKRFFWVLLCLLGMDVQAQSEIILGLNNIQFTEHKMFVTEQNERYDVIESNFMGENKIIVRKNGVSGVVEKTFTRGEHYGMMELEDAVLDSDGSLYLLLMMNYNRFVVLKLDENLELDWSRVLVEMPGFFTYFKNIIKLSGDEHLLVSISGFDNHLAFKLDRTGTVIWRNSYSPLFCDKCPGFDLLPYEDGALMSMKAGSMAVIYRIDAAGDVLWSKRFEDGVYRQPRAIYVLDDLIYLSCTADNLQHQMFVINMDGDLLNAYYYNVGTTYYVYMHHYLDRFYYQTTQIEPNGDVINQIVEMDHEFHTLAAYKGDFVDLYSTISTSDVNRTGGELLLSKNKFMTYSFPIADMANNACLQAFEFYDLFYPEGALDNLIQQFTPGMVSKTALPILSIPFDPLPIANSSELTQMTDCSENVALSTGTSESFAHLYPNPANDVLNLSSSSALKQIVVLDLQGRVMKIVNEPTNTIDLSDLQTGNYMVQLHFSNGTFINEKIVLAR